MAGNITPFNRALGVNEPSMMWNPNMPFGLQQLDAVINRDALQIAYANDFLFMFYASLPVLLFIWLMRKPQLQVQPKLEDLHPSE